MKLCKDCKFCKPFESFLVKEYRNAKCLHKKHSKIDPVEGKISGAYCSDVRRSYTNGSCGYEGNLFEAKK